VCSSGSNEPVIQVDPVWNYSFDDNRSEESQPLVYKGVLYVTSNSATMAIDTKIRQADLEDQGRVSAGDAAHRLLRDHQSRRTWRTRDS
jgi:F0F1-type ATP synthase epsilon subunit